MIDSVNVIVRFVIGAREEVNSAVNQMELFIIGIPFSRAENGMCEIVNEDIIGIVSFGSVDDDGLQVFVPALRLAEKFAQVVFAFNGVISEAVDECIRNVVENVIRIGVAEIIAKSRPDVVAHEIFEFVHGKYLRK